MATDMKILEQACKNVRTQGWWTSFQGCPVLFDGALEKILDEYEHLKYPHWWAAIHHALRESLA